MRGKEQARRRAYLSAAGGIFTSPADQGDTAAAQSSDVSHYAAKVTEAGLMLDVDFFPVWSSKSAARAAKESITRDAQRKLNAKNTRKYITQLIHENFDANDIAITLTFFETMDGQEYIGSSPPTTEVRKKLTSYIRALRRHFKREGLGEFKYIYVIEGGDFSKRERKRVHVHMIMSGMDREEAEALWPHGRANTRKLRPSPGDGLAGISLYMTKTMPDARYSPSARRWGRSKNLAEPTVSYPPHKLSRRRAARMLADKEEARRRIEASFPDYRVSGDVEFYKSDFVGGIYIRARLFHFAAPPGWEHIERYMREE